MRVRASFVLSLLVGVFTYSCKSKNNDSSLKSGLEGYAYAKSEEQPTEGFYYSTLNKFPPEDNQLVFLTFGDNKPVVLPVNEALNLNEIDIEVNEDNNILYLNLVHSGSRRLGTIRNEGCFRSVLTHDKEYALCSIELTDSSPLSYQSIEETRLKIFNTDMLFNFQVKVDEIVLETVCRLSNESCAREVDDGFYYAYIKGSERELGGLAYIDRSRRLEIFDKFENYYFILGKGNNILTYFQESVDPETEKQRNPEFKGSLGVVDSKGCKGINLKTESVVLCPVKFNTVSGSMISLNKGIDIHINREADNSIDFMSPIGFG